MQDLRHQVPGFQAVLASQARINRSAATVPELYAEHRDRLTAAILALRPIGDAGTLCLLGAGNCNDVRLDVLAGAFGEIHLVDLDATALARARQRQPPDVRARLRVHAPLDLSGVLGHLDRWKRRPPSPAEQDAAVGSGVHGILQPMLRALGPLAGAGFDVVASCCVATQMAFQLAATLGKDFPLLPDLRKRVATVHLRALCGLVRSGGRGLFATDIVSNETFPLDDIPSDADLTALLGRLITDGNYFFGSEPPLYTQILRKDQVLAGLVDDLRRLEPWLWRAGQEKLFLVSGFSFGRR